MESPIAPFEALTKTVGWQTTTQSQAFLLPECADGAQVRIFNATAGEKLYAFVAFGPEGIEASAWSAEPPATCDFVIGPDSERIVTLSAAQQALAQSGQLYAAACLYQGAGGIYFTCGRGLS
jgi:hypothetical protein